MRLLTSAATGGLESRRFFTQNDVGVMLGRIQFGFEIFGLFRQIVGKRKWKSFKARCRRITKARFLFAQLRSLRQRPNFVETCMEQSKKEVIGTGESHGCIRRQTFWTNPNKNSVLTNSWSCNKARQLS